jgi:hypothetical protein
MNTFMGRHLTFHIVQPPDGESPPDSPASIGIIDTDSARLPPLSTSPHSSLAAPVYLATSLFSATLLALLHGDVPPNDRQETTGQRHPDDAYGRGHARYVIPEVQFGEEEAERRGLHGRLDGHGARLHLPEPGELGQPVTDDAPDEVEEEDGDLRARASLFFGRYTFTKRKRGGGEIIAGKRGISTRR